jgi:hypothetical protein
MRLAFPRRALVALFVTFSLSACSGDDSPTNPPAEDDPAPDAIGSTGGTVQAQDGSVTVQVPPGAVSSDITITVEPTPDPVDDPNTLPGTVYDFGPDGTTFAQPVALTLAYSATAVPDDLPAGAVRIAKLIDAAWVPIAGEVTVDTIAGTVTGEITSFSQYAVVADRCALRPLTLDVTRTIDGTDCYFSDNAEVERYEERYSVDAAALVTEAGATLSGTPRLNLRLETDFDAVIEFREQAGEGEAFRYRSRATEVDAETGTAAVEFSMYAGEGTYELVVGGALASAGGTFTLTTTVEPGGTFDPARDVGAFTRSASFSSTITESNSFEGTVAFGPFAGEPLFYQYRLAQLEAGRSYRYRIERLSADSPVAAFVSATPLSEGVDQEIDFGDAGGTSREITFTASQTGFYYFEVSGPQGVNESYDLTFEELSDFDACAPRTLASQHTGTLNGTDCAAGGQGATAYEESYTFATASFAAARGVTGPALFDISLTASFNGTLTLNQTDQELATRDFQASTPRSMYILADGGSFEVTVRGGDDTQVGGYDLSTSVGEIGNYFCGTGFLATTLTFSSTITDVDSCAGTIEFGPNVGQPLQFQYWYAKLEAGTTYTFEATGITNPTFALFVSNADFATEQTLDLGEADGDTDRIVTFTPAATTYYYIEVSKAPGDAAPYTLSFREGS